MQVLALTFITYFSGAIWLHSQDNPAPVKDVFLSANAVRAAQFASHRDAHTLIITRSVPRFTFSTTPDPPELKC